MYFYQTYLFFSIDCKFSENLITKDEIGKQERGKKILREANYEGGIIGFLCSLSVNLKELWEN
jgi:hypothetical protein